MVVRLYLSGLRRISPDRPASPSRPIQPKLWSPPPRADELYIPELPFAAYCPESDDPAELGVVPDPVAAGGAAGDDPGLAPGVLLAEVALVSPVAPTPFCSREPPLPAEP